MQEQEQPKTVRRRACRTTKTSNEEAKKQQKTAKKPRKNANLDPSVNDEYFDFSDRETLTQLFKDELAKLKHPALAQNSEIHEFYLRIPGTQAQIQQKYVELCKYVMRNNLAYEHRDLVFKFVRRNNEEYALFHKNKQIDVMINNEHVKVSRNWVSRYNNQQAFVPACTTLFPIAKVLYPSRTGKNNLEIQFTSKNLGEVLAEAEGIRQFSGLSFIPGKPRGDDDSTFNLWEKWGCTPDDSDDYASKCQKIIRHIREVLSDGKENKHVFLMNWLAHMIQKPWELQTKCLVFKSKEGTGKNTLFTNIMRQIIGTDHYFESQNKNDFVGNFNGHLEGMLLGVANEAFFVGDIEANNALKGQITADTIKVNEKYEKAYDIENRMRLVMLSNHDHVVQVSTDNRRYVIYEVSDKYKDDHRYFDPLYNEINNGGIAAFFRYLQEFKIDESVLRYIPEDEAQNEQKIRSLSAENQFFYEVLQNGEVRSEKILKWITKENRPELEGDIEWLTKGQTMRFSSDDFYEKYQEFCSSIRKNYRVNRGVFYSEFQKAFAGGLTERCEAEDTQRIRCRLSERMTGQQSSGPKVCWEIHDIFVMREIFEKNVLGFKTTWQTINESDNQDIYNEDKVISLHNRKAYKDKFKDEDPHDYSAPF